jgi:hypothetical protein
MFLVITRKQDWINRFVEIFPQGESMRGFHHLTEHKTALLLILNMSAKMVSRYNDQTSITNGSC